MACQSMSDCVQMSWWKKCQAVCSSEYIKVDVLCGQRHRVVPLNHSNPVHINTTPEQYMHSFVLIFYGTLGSFIGTSSDRGYQPARAAEEVSSSSYVCTTVI
jgi:hypothetical protein